MAAATTRSLTFEFVLPAPPLQVYKAWLNSKEHSALSGSKAVIRARVGAKYTAWDNYISGKNLELQPGRKIVQSWRTTEFPDDSPDSRIEIRLSPHAKGTRFVFKHTKIPAGQAGQYKIGWRDYYWKPMQKYFASKDHDR